PADVRASCRAGTSPNQAVLTWDPPANDPSASFRVTVNGEPKTVGGRELVVPDGATYSVVAVNAVGTSAPVVGTAPTCATSTNQLPAPPQNLTDGCGSGRSSGTAH